MASIPIFLKAEDQQILLVGATSAAMAKLALLSESGAPIHLVGQGSKQAVLDAGLADTDGLTVSDRAFDAHDIDGATLVYIATDDRFTEEKVRRLAQEQRLPVNVVDKPSLSSFITPAIFRRGDLSVALSSGGSAPVFVRRLRALLERIISPALGTLTSAASEVRADLPPIIPEINDRRLFWDSVFDRASDYKGETQASLQARLIREAQAFAAQNTGHTGRVQLVGAGPGAADLLTLRAHRALQEADVILFDQLVSPEVLALARRDADRIFVGKYKGNHGVGQDGIAALMIEHAQAGKRVVRLKSGDPLHFGRAGEELEALRTKNIPVDVIPGITALTACAAEAQIPVTDRAFSTSLTMVTGHTKHGAFEDYARIAGQGSTLAVYMGIGTAKLMRDGLIGAGVRAHTPVAIIENGTRDNERRLYGTLDALPDIIESEAVASPALIIIGDVVTRSRDWPAHIANTNATQEAVARRSILSRLAVAAW